MKQTVLEIRQRAEELMKEFTQIWQHSQFSEDVADLHKDPVFMMFIMALAYQANEIDNEIERFRLEIKEDIERILLPYEAMHALPASLLIQTLPREDLSQVDLNENIHFYIGNEFHFMPLFKSKVLNVKVDSIERIDGRRWKVNLSSPYPISDLSGFSFGIKNTNFSTLSVKLNNRNLPLIRPWNYAELPFVNVFSQDSMAYNHGEYYSPSMLPLDIFARQELRLFWIENDNRAKIEENEKFELIFEFNSIEEDFIFDKDQIILNTVVLTNVSIREATLSNYHPIDRIGDITETGETANHANNQFLQLVKPPSTVFNSDIDIEVRKVAGDRYNTASLIRLFNFIVDKYGSDFYAYQTLPEIAGESFIFNLKENIKKLKQLLKKEDQVFVPGIYLMIRDRNLLKEKKFSLSLKYLTTSGASVNQFLKSENTELSVVPGLDNSETHVIFKAPGVDEINLEGNKRSVASYYLLTGDRIVTMADIKAFCYMELLRLFNISREFVKSFKIDRRLSNEIAGSGYEIYVDIVLHDNAALRKTFMDKIPGVELLLKKMMESRSSGIYPYRVNIMIEE